jgi:hypothetical protein
MKNWKYYTCGELGNFVRLRRTVHQKKMRTTQGNSFFMLISTVVRSRDSVVGIAIDWTTKWSEFESLLGRRPHRLWSPPSLLSNRYKGSFPRQYSGRKVRSSLHFYTKILVSIAIYTNILQYFIAKMHVYTATSSIFRGTAELEKTINT